MCQKEDRSGDWKEKKRQNFSCLRFSLVGDGDENVDDEDNHQNDDDDDDDNRLYFYAAVHRLVERKSRSRRIIHRVQPSKYVVTLDRDQEVIISNLSDVIFIITSH